MTSVEAQRELIEEIEVERIVMNPFQPRRQFSEEELQELAASIVAVGIIHPPIVRPIGEEGLYELVAGERRLRAAQLAGLRKIPVIIRDSSMMASAQAALIENMQRVDLNAMEVSKALHRLSDEFGLSQDELAQRIGKKRSTVSNYLRLLGLPLGIQESVSKGLITLGHAKAILSLEGFEKQNLLHEIILRDGLSVHETEEWALKIAEKAKKNKLTYVNRDFYLEQLAEKIQHKLGTKVHIQGKGKKGRICIDYYNLDDLDRLLGLFGVSEI
jgi:ParB family chromosome partitioning protein